MLNQTTAANIKFFHDSLSVLFFLAYQWTVHRFV